MKLLVWVLIVSSWNSSRNEVEQLGYYTTKEECEIIKNSEPLKHFERQCLNVEVWIP